MSERADSFLAEVASVLEVPSVTPETELRSVPTWSSLTAFALVVTLDQKYSRRLTFAELSSLRTVGDLMKTAGVS